MFEKQTAFLNDLHRLTTAAAATGAAAISAIAAVISLTTCSLSPQWKTVKPEVTKEFDPSCQYRWTFDTGVPMLGYETGDRDYVVYATTVQKDGLAASNGLRLFWVVAKDAKIMHFGIMKPDGVHTIEDDPGHSGGLRLKMLESLCSAKSG